MQAGFTYRPIIARRDGAQTEARSVMGEFVSGNYFRTFGLRPQAGRLLTDSDDVKGAPQTAVMSYETWQNQFAGDAAVVGSTFWVNTKPVTVVGIAPRGFYGDRLTSTPPDFYLPIETMPALANAPYVHDPETIWLYIVGRVRPGVAPGALQEKVNAVLRQAFATQKLIYDGTRQEGVAEGAYGADAGWRRYPDAAGRLRVSPSSADVDLRTGAFDCLREYREPAAGAGHGSQDGDVSAVGTGSGAVADRSPAADGEHSAGGFGRARGARCRLRSALACC